MMIVSEMENVQEITIVRTCTFLCVPSGRTF